MTHPEHIRQRILVVEDEEAIREIIVAMLSSAKYVCREARDGYEALTILDSGEEFALVLSNLIMPGLDGFGLLERVKTTYPDIPVVITTTVTDASVLRDVIQRGAHDYLLKPFARAQLLVTVRRAIENRMGATNRLCAIFQPQRCPQCRMDDANFQYDARTGRYQIECGRCGYCERHIPEHDDEGFYSGYVHVVRKGAGALWFKRSGERHVHCHYLNKPGEVIEAEHWLRAHLETGSVDAPASYLTEWNDAKQQVDVLIGDLLDFLAGNIETASGLPKECASPNR